MPTREEPIGIRELRAKLASYLAAVARGATVTISRRHRVIARLVPAAVPSSELERPTRPSLEPHRTPKLGRRRRIRLGGRGPLASELVRLQRR
jgi:prevent-host-death family protein